MSKEIKRYLKDDAATVYDDAHAWCYKTIKEAESCIQLFEQEEHIDLKDLCFVVVGSTGRSEALAASDFDLVPIARRACSLAEYVDHDARLRELLTEALKMKVSKGQNLTKTDIIDNLIERASIGGEHDNS